MDFDPLDFLSRRDKWFLASGRAGLFAPPFLQWPDALGFWEECYYADLRFERLFTAVVVDEQNRPQPLVRRTADWRPDRLVTLFRGPDFELREEKAVIAGELFVCRFSFRPTDERQRTLHLLTWSCQPHSPELAERRYTADEPQVERDGIALRIRYQRGEEIVLGAKLLSRPKPYSVTINLVEPDARLPRWESSVFPEKFRRGRLAGERKVSAGATGAGDLHLALHHPLSLEPGADTEVIIAFSLQPEPPEEPPAGPLHLETDPIAFSEEAWRRFFDSVPQFHCDDPHIEKYYWYRWYGLRLGMVGLCRGHLAYPCVFEGIGGFRTHISYSAQCHALECAWMHFPQFAEGSLQNFVHNQAASGSVPGHIGLGWHGDDFYHANWGEAALQVYDLHGEVGFLKSVYPGLSRYAEYFARERDPEGSHLYDVVNQGETGQEYASRYLFADPAADAWKPMRLKGVDSTTYIYLLQQSLAEMARLLELESDVTRWTDEAAATRAALLSRMWDPEREAFFDVRPGDWQRSPALPAVSFYPFLTDIVGPEHLPAIRRYLLSPEKFWTDYPVPTVSLDDPFFDAEAEWKGQRMGCPWSGRMWHMTSSHVAEALARTARWLDPSLRPQAAELIRRFIRTMFFDGDAARPNCFEHYNPFTGQPCLYRGIDDYQHSWVVDLIIKHVAGVQPQRGPRLVIDPLDFGLDRFRLDRLRYKGRWIGVAWDRGSGLRVRVDGDLRAESATLARLEVPLD